MWRADLQARGRRGGAAAAGAGHLRSLLRRRHRNAHLRHAANFRVRAWVHPEGRGTGARHPVHVRSAAAPPRHCQRCATAQFNLQASVHRAWIVLTRACLWDQDCCETCYSRQLDFIGTDACRSVLEGPAVSFAGSLSVLATHFNEQQAVQMRQSPVLK